MKYEKHKMEAILFEEEQKNLFVVASTNDGDPNGSYTWSILPDRSDS